MLIALASVGPTAESYEIGTHQAISEKAAQTSSLDDVLRTSLGFRKGLDETFRDQAGKEASAVEWIREGSAWEDNIPRFFFHFHDPLRPWDDSGFGLIPRLQSSIRWAQNPIQDWSWPNVRQYYLQALTAPTKADRERAFADTFRGLGQVIHLIQDAASPAHARNDPHVTYNYEKLVRDVQASQEAQEKAFFQGLLSTSQRPDPGWQLLARNDLAPVPIARLLDTDQYTGTNPGITTSPLMGLVEYTNANFFSEDRTFPEDTLFLFRYPYPAHSSASEADYPITLATGDRVTRRYFTKVADGDTGYRLATVGFLQDYLQRYGLDPNRYADKPALDESVYKDYASRLVPRAVGFSTALLDYFFRGKLDVDLVEDPADPSVLRLAGTNASTDPLVDGTLTLFADDPNGLRSPALALDPTSLTDVAPGQALSSARFQAPENAERFIAVYQGTLGQEVRPSDPNLPGAVIGKVMGGVRVEEVFSDGTRWKIRTPLGVFLLPLTVAEFEQVRWGDADSTLLAQTPFGPGRPNRFVVYEVQREPNSVEFKTLAMPEGLAVQVSQKREAVFPFGMSLGTTVQFSQTIQYRQLLARYDRTGVWKWTPSPYTFHPPGTGSYVFDHLEFGPLTIETAHQQVVPFNLSFPITLDLDQEARPYWWRLRDVAVDVSGRLVGVVAVFPGFLTSPTVDIPLFAVNRQGDLEIADHTNLGPRFPAGVYPLLWALVDLAEGRVIASTAADPLNPVITISRQQAVDLFWRNGTWAHIFVSQEGGPQPGLKDLGWYGPQRLVPPDELHPIGNIAELHLQTGEQAISVNGWLRQELQEALSRAGLFSFQLRSRQTSRDLVYDCVSATSCSAIRIVSTDTDLFPRPAQLWDGTRAHPAPGGERMVFLDQGKRILLVWDPGTPRAQLLQLPEGYYYLGPASQASVLVFSEEFPPPDSSTLIPLEGAQGVAVVLNVDLYDSFALLDPSYLYNVEDGKFYRPQPPLRRTALPAKLADVPGNPIGDYHAIRLP